MEPDRGPNVNHDWRRAPPRSGALAGRPRSKGVTVGHPGSPRSGMPDRLRGSRPRQPEDDAEVLAAGERALMGA